MQKPLQDYLKKEKIVYEEYVHPPVFTCEDARVHCKHIPGIPCKNLFLEDGKNKKFYLATIPDKKRLDMKKLAKELSADKLQFAKPDALMKYLQLTPGSVSPFGLIHDTEKKVLYLIDKEIWDAEMVNFHPNINTASLALDKKNFHKFIESMKREIRIMKM